MRIARDALPKTQYGTQCRAGADRAPRARGVTIAASEAYARDHGVGEPPATASPAITDQAAHDALLIPEGGDAACSLGIGPGAERRRRPQNVKVLGTGLWDDNAHPHDADRRKAASMPASAPDVVADFEGRYRRPMVRSRRASRALPMTRVSLAIGLAKRGDVHGTRRSPVRRIPGPERPLPLPPGRPHRTRAVDPADDAGGVPSRRAPPPAASAPASAPPILPVSSGKLADDAH